MARAAEHSRRRRRRRRKNRPTKNCHLIRPTVPSNENVSGEIFFVVSVSADRSLISGAISRSADADPTGSFRPKDGKHDEVEYEPPEWRPVSLEARGLNGRESWTMRAARYACWDAGAQHRENPQQFRGTRGARVINYAKQSHQCERAYIWDSPLLKRFFVTAVALPLAGSRPRVRAQPDPALCG